MRSARLVSLAALAVVRGCGRYVVHC
jgi:hypothetical protein